MHIHGSPGLGKSETAIAFANLHLDKLSLVWHIRCESNLLYDEAYRLLAATLKIHVEEKETTEQVVRKVHFYLENTQEEKSWLLILDNIESSIPIPERGGIVITTSRHEKLGSENPAFFPISPFDLEETRNFLIKEGVQEDQLDELERLHQELEGWPLLLSQVPPYLRNNPFKISDYLKELQLIDPLFVREENAKYPHSLGAAFAITLQTIEKSNPEAKALLYYCTFLNPDNINVELFKAWYKDAPLLWMKRTIDLLINIGGIFRNIDGRNVFSLHRLWQKFLEKDLITQQKAENQFLQTVELLQEEVKGFDQDNNKTWNLGKMCSLHLEKLRSFDMWKRLKPEKKCALLNLAGVWMVLVAGNPAKALDYFETALNIAEENLEEVGLQKTAEIYDNLGWSFAELGRYEIALEKSQKALEIAKKNLGENHPKTAEFYNHVGLKLGFMSCHEKALEHQEKALEIRRNYYGEKHKYTAESYDNTGLSLSYLSSYDKSLDYRTKALEIYKEVLGELHQDTATSYSNVGSSLGRLGRHEEALKYKRKALEIREKLFEKEHPLIAQNYSNIGFTLGDLGQHEDALKYKQKAFEIAKKTLGENHPSTAIYCNNVGFTLGDLGRHDEALVYKQKALNVRKEKLGEEHAYTAGSYYNVGMSLLELNKKNEALDYLEKSLVIRIKILGEKHPDTAKSYDSIASCYSELGDKQKALEYKQKALKIYKEKFGDNHPNTKKCSKDINLIVSFIDSTKT